MESFVRHKNQSYPPLDPNLENYDQEQRQIFSIIVSHNTNPAPPDDVANVLDAVLLDGAAIINVLPPGAALNSHGVHLTDSNV